MTTSTTTTTLPTISCSLSVAFGLNSLQMSMVKMVLELLKAEDSEDMRAAIMTASISPTSPVGRISNTSLCDKINETASGHSEYCDAEMEKVVDLPPDLKFMVKTSSHIHIICLL